MTMHRSGFTLVEVLLYTAVAAGVAVAALQAMQFLDAAQARATARTGVDAEAVFLSDSLRTALRGRTAVAPVSQESGGTLTLSDGTEISVAQGRAVIERGGPAEYLTSSRVTVSGLQFRNLAVPGSPDLVRVEFTMTASPAGGTADVASYSHDYRTTIGIR